MKIPAILETEWEKFIDAAYDGIVIADGEGKIVYMNPASERLEEMHTDKIIGRFACDLEAEGIYETSATVRVLREKKPVSVMQYRGGKQLVLSGIPIFENRKIKWIIINERDVTELNLVKSELERLKSQTHQYNFPIAESKPMRKIMETLERVATIDICVLIEGESGTGKGIIAEWIHQNSARRTKPFIKIDCGSLPETLLESELFGYAKGAFTGANREGKKGLVEAAASGTLFLDEIGEMPLSLQVKLLRLIQEKAYIPIGSVHEKKVDIRIIAATNRELMKMVEEGHFRADLYYRLNVIPIKLPPLNERGTDIFNFVNYYLDYYNEKYNYKKTFGEEALKALYNYSWPGNVRELSNVVERLVVVTGKPIIEIEDVADVIETGMDIKNSGIRLTSVSYKAAVAQFEKEYIETVRGQVNTIAELAELLGVSLSTMKRKLKEHNCKGSKTTPVSNMDPEKETEENGGIDRIV